MQRGNNSAYLFLSAAVQINFIAAALLLRGAAETF
jgi:hypothetical protein